MLNKFSKKSITILASSLLLLSNLAACSNLTSTPTPTSSSSTSSQEKALVTNKLKLTKTNKEGVQSPIVPEDINYIKVGDQQIKASQIKIDNKSFSTKATTAPLVRATYLGNGEWQFEVLVESVKFVEIVTKDGQTIKVPVVDLKKVTEFRVDFNEVSKQLVGAELNEDGSLKDKGNLFKVDADGKETLNQETKLEDLKDVLKDVSPLAGYMGNWVYNGIGFSIKLNVRSGGENKLSVSADAFGQKGSGLVDYTTEADGGILGSAKISSGTIKAKAQIVSAQKIKVSLVDAGGISAVEPFKFLLSNIELQRSVE